MAGMMAAPRGALLSERAAGEVGDELRRRRVSNPTTSSMLAFTANGMH
jgi:hypothetical protein